MPIPDILRQPLVKVRKDEAPTSSFNPISVAGPRIQPSVKVRPLPPQPSLKVTTKQPSKFNATFFDPKDPFQTRPDNPEGIGAFGTPVQFGDVATGVRSVPQGTLIKIKQLEDVETPHGRGVFRVNDRKNVRFDTPDTQNFDIALPAETPNREQLQRRIGNNVFDFEELSGPELPPLKVSEAPTPPKLGVKGPEREKSLSKIFGESFNRGFLRLGSALETIVSVGAKKIGAEQLSEKLATLAKNDKELASVGIQVEDNRKFVEKMRDPKWIVQGIGETLPTLLFGIGVGLPAAAVGAPTLVIGGTAFAGTATLEAGFAFQDAKEFGVDDQKAEKVAAIVGVANGMLEALPITKLLSRSPAGKTVKRNIIREITRRVTQQAGLESGTESLQEIVQNSVAKTYDENRELLAGVPESASFGGILGGGVSLGADIVTGEPTREALRSKEGFAKIPRKDLDQFVPTEEEIAKGRIEPTISPELEPLAKEARKFKSAEEFVENSKSLLDIEVEKLFIKRNGQEAFDEGVREGAFGLEKIEQFGREYNEVFIKKHPNLVDKSIIVYHDAVKGDDLAVVANGKVVEVFDKELKSQLTDIFNQAKATQAVKAIPTELEPLAVEARKFKSAEEFVEAQPKVFRGTENKIENPSDIETDLIFSSTSKKFASEFGKNIEEYRVDLRNPYDFEKTGGFYKFKNGKFAKGEDGEKIEIGFLDANPEIVNDIKRRGFDGAIDGGGEFTVVFDNSQLKTKSQLTDIFNQAKGEVKKPTLLKPGQLTERPERLDRERVVGQDALNAIDEITRRLKLSNVDRQAVDVIKTAEGGAFGATLANTIVIEKEGVPEFTGQHEMGHLIFRHMHGIDLFTDKGITREGMIEEARKIFPNQSDQAIEEMIMEDLEIYLQEQSFENVRTTGSKIRSFFEEVLAFMKRMFTGENKNQIRDFINIVTTGEAKVHSVLQHGVKPDIRMENGKLIADYSGLTGVKTAEIAKPIPPELRPLAREARKFKSAEEFVEKTIKPRQVELDIVGKVGPFFQADTLDSGTLTTLHGKRFADNVFLGNKVVVWRAGQNNEKLIDGKFLTADKGIAELYLKDPRSTNPKDFGGPSLNRFEVDANDLISIDNLDFSELVFRKGGGKTIKEQGVAGVVEAGLPLNLAAEGKPITRKSLTDFFNQAKGVKEAVPPKLESLPAKPKRITKKQIEEQVRPPTKKVTKKEDVLLRQKLRVEKRGAKQGIAQFKREQKFLEALKRDIDKSLKAPKGKQRSAIAFVKKLGEFNQTTINDVKKELGITKAISQMNIVELGNFVSKLKERLKFKFERGFRPSAETTEKLGIVSKKSEPPVIKDDVYQANIEVQKKTPKLQIKETLQKAGDEVDKTLGTISSRLADIDPSLRIALRRFIFNSNQRVIKDKKIVVPFLEKYNTMTKDDRATFDFAAKNRDIAKQEALAKQYGFEQEMKTTKALFDDIYARANEVGFDIGYLKNYFPRMVKDTKGLVEFFSEADENTKSIIDEAVKRKEMDLGRALTTDEKAYLINNMIRGYSGGQITLSAVSNMKDRVIDFITPEMNKFYFTTSNATLRYIESVDNAIEARKFFGKSQIVDKKVDQFNNLDDSIGAFMVKLLAEGKVTPKQELEVREILNAFFGEKGTHGAVSLYKNLAYLDVMGSPINALTQIGDLAFPLYNVLVGNAGAFETGNALIRAGVGKSKITKEDIGIERIAIEMEDASLTANLVDTVFKVVGLTKIDTMGKETLINPIVARYQKLAKKPTPEFEKEMKDIFGDDAKQTIEDLKNDNMTENAKFLAFYKLLDFQPVAKSEVPQRYLTGGNLRILYQLKTWTLKMFDVYRNEVFRTMRTNKVQGMRNMVLLSMALVLMNATADELKDLVLGRKTSLKDRLIDNIAKLIGFSRYSVNQVSRNGIGSAILEQLTPPTQFVDNISKDLIKIFKDWEESIKINNLKSIKSIPVLGNLYYWWFGKGVESKEREKKKIKKEPTTRFKRPSAEAKTRFTRPEAGEAVRFQRP